MSEAVPLLDCQITAALTTGEGAASAPTELRVGDPMTLTCRGAIEVPLQDPVHIRFDDPNQKHDLKVAKTLKSDQDYLVLEVYSHKAGSHKDKSFILTDGITSYKAEGLQYEITSVLQQGDEMNPPYGPLSLSYPMWFWLVIAAIILAIALVILNFQRRARARRQLILNVLGEGRDVIPFKELVKIQNAQAYNQFSRDLRAIQKKLAWGKVEPTPLWKELEKSFKYYLARELLTPAFAWSRRDVLKDIKKHHPRVYQETKRELQEILQEFEKGRDQKISVRDCEQVYLLSRTIGEKIYETRRRGRSA